MALGCAVLLPLVAWRLTNSAARFAARGEQQTRLGDLRQICRRLSAAIVVKAFGMEDFEIRKFGEAATNCSAKTCAGACRGDYRTLMDLLGAIAIPLLLLYAATDSLQRMTEGQFFAFLYAMFNAYMPLKRTGYIYQQLQAVEAESARRYFLISIARRKKASNRRPCRWHVFGGDRLRQRGFRL